MDSDHLRSWIGRTEARHDLPTAAAMSAFLATLDRPDAVAHADDPLFPLAHWLLFNPAVPARELGDDGHPRRGSFLPPVSLPRRMWAGGRLAFVVPLRVGLAAERTSTIRDVQVKQGKSGSLVFVTVAHAITSDGALALTEEHDIVYREAPVPGIAPAAPAAPIERAADFERAIRPDPVLLFRYSALTFNGHRIHYDQPYVTQVEGYPGLIVHGPLIATFLVDLLLTEQPDLVLERFEFKAVTPLFDTQPFCVRGRAVDATTFSLWAETPDGRLAMDATATVRPR